MRTRALKNSADKVFRARRLIAPCCPHKYGYTSRKDAKAAAAYARTATGETIEAYHCVSGHCWHIGHPSKGSQ